MRARKACTGCTSSAAGPDRVDSRTPVHTAGPGSTAAAGAGTTWEGGERKSDWGGKLMHFQQLMKNLKGI